MSPGSTLSIMASREALTHQVKLLHCAMMGMMIVQNIREELAGPNTDIFAEILTKKLGILSWSNFILEQNKYNNTKKTLILTIKLKEKFEAFQANYQIRFPFSVDTVSLKIHFQSCPIFVLLARDELA